MKLEINSVVENQEQILIIISIQIEIYLNSIKN